MDFKQEFSKQITKINMKTSNFLEENKIKTYVATLEGEIKDLKFKAGELGYVKWFNKESSEEDLKKIYSMIAERYEIIHEQEKILQDLSEKGKQVLGEASGEVVIFCPNCGERYAKVPNFCIKCGAKMR